MSKKILIVEDEIDFVEIIKLRLESWGYETAVAYDGEEGLKKALEEKPDLILLDIIMPKLDGVTLCGKLKKDPRTKNIPIIIVSASGWHEMPKTCKEAGAEDFILKPFEMKDFSDRIARLLNK